MKSLNRTSGLSPASRISVLLLILGLVALVGLYMTSSRGPEIPHNRPSSPKRRLSGLITPAGVVNSSIALPDAPPTSCLLNPNNKFAYLISEVGVVIVNITDFNKITKQSIYEVDDPIQMVLSNNAEIGFLGTRSDYGLMVLDLTAVPSGGDPILITNYSIDGIDSVAITSNNQILYVADEDSGLHTLNISDLTNIRVITSTGLDKSGINEVTGLYMLNDDKTLIATDMTYGIKILNLDDTMISSPKGDLAIDGANLLAVAPNEVSAVVATTSDDLVFVNITDTTSPSKLTTISHVTVLNMEISSDSEVLFVSTGTDIKAYNITT